METIKPCKRKVYTTFICKPKEGTVIVRPEGYRVCGGKKFLTPEEVKQIQMQNSSLYTFLQRTAYMVRDKDFVVVSPDGDLAVIPITSVVSSYVLASDGSEITPATLKKLSNKENLMKWVQVKTILRDTRKEFAQFIPYPQQLRLGMEATNDNTGHHGKGDFIVYQTKVNGEPVQSTGRIVRGATFKYMYDNRGWSDCLSDEDVGIALNNLPELVKDEQILVEERSFLGRMFSKLTDNRQDIIEKTIKKVDHLEVVDITNSENTDGYLYTTCIVREAKYNNRLYKIMFRMSKENKQYNQMILLDTANESLAQNSEVKVKIQDMKQLDKYLKKSLYYMLRISGFDCTKETYKVKNQDKIYDFEDNNKYQCYQTYISVVQKVFGNELIFDRAQYIFYNERLEKDAGIVLEFSSRSGATYLGIVITPTVEKQDCQIKGQICFKLRQRGGGRITKFLGYEDLFNTSKTLEILKLLVFK